MKPLKLLAFALSLAVSLAVAACSSSGDFTPDKSDMLTKAELSMLTAHARAFIEKTRFDDKGKEMLQGSKRNLSPSELAVMKNTEPSFIIKYTGSKEGQLSMSWEISRERKLILLLDGPFLAKRPQWTLQMVTTSAPSYYKDSVPVDAPKLTPPPEQ